MGLNKMFKFIKENEIDSFGKLIRYLIATLIYDKNWIWLEFIISTICEIEVQLPIIFNKNLHKKLRSADIIQVYPEQEDKETFAQRVIPKNTFYCEDCPFKTQSKIAKVLYGEQSSGYCLYLSKGDFSFIRPTDLLWDGCKECGINSDIKDGNWEEINE